MVNNKKPTWEKNVMRRTDNDGWEAKIRESQPRNRKKKVQTKDQVH